MLPQNIWIIFRYLKLVHALSRRKDGSYDRELSNIVESRVPAKAEEVDGVATMDVTIDHITKVWARIFLPVDCYRSAAVPVGAGSDPAANLKHSFIFFYHAGLFCHITAADGMYDLLCRRIAKTCQAVVMSVDYRRSPEVRCPTAYEDSFAALRWLQLQVLGGAAGTWLPPSVDLSRTFLVGDGAGGNIVHHVGVRAAVEDIRPLRVRGHCLITPMFGGVERTRSETEFADTVMLGFEASDWYWKAFLPVGADRNHPACNIFGPNGPDLTPVRLPKTLLICGAVDVRYDWQLQYAEGMTKAGKEVEMVVFENCAWGFYIFPNTPVSHNTMDKIKEFVNPSD